MSLRVLFQNRSDMCENRGGDSIQLIKTQEYLQKMGVKVDLSLQIAADLSRYDLVHLFNITKVDETYIHVRNAKKNKKKIVLSPIYWNKEEFLTSEEKFPLERRIMRFGAKHFPCLRSIKRAFRCTEGVTYAEFIELQRFVLENSNAILPNSALERDLLIRDFPEVNSGKYCVIPNGVEINMLQTKRGDSKSMLNLKDCIVCVGRIEERKNQYRLIKALSDFTVPLVLVGKVTQSYYARVCKKEARKRDNVYFLGELTHEELGSIYSYAKVHALPSWYETPGLANLEAGLMGCNLAIGNRGSVKEYFADFADYCEPSSEDSIREAVMKAYSAPRNNKLSGFIRENYGWEVVAKKTLDSYYRVLKNDIADVSNR